MPKMKINADDGTITLPVKGREAVTLDEPSLADLAWLTEEAEKLDKDLPELPGVTDNSDAEQLKAWADASHDRTMAIYQTAVPYGKLLIDVVKRLSDGKESVDETQLYGWAASPAVIREMLEFWRAPLPGPASRPNL